MAIIRAQVALAPSNGLPEDVTVNTFHFSTADLASGTLDSIQTALKAFYNVIPTATGGTVALTSFMSTQVAQNGHQITMYDMADATPRVPIREHTWNFALAPNGQPLPGEISLVLSFQGDKVSGEKQARKRGRIYFGRLETDALSGGRPTGTILANLAAAGETLRVASEFTPEWTWIVLSQAFDGTLRLPGGEVVPHPTRAAYGQTFAAVTNGWVDNDFDIQRRRGVAATARTLWGA